MSDPAHPVEYIDQIAIGMTGDYMIQDQRVASRRPDVLVYESDALASRSHASPGPIQAEHVRFDLRDRFGLGRQVDRRLSRRLRQCRSNAPAVKFGGYQQLVRGDVMRGKFRNSLEKPEPSSPTSRRPVNFTLQDVAHTFRSGHKIMVQVQSTWFPLIDRNPQKFVDIYSATEADFQKATQRVYHSPEMPSHLEVLEVVRVAPHPEIFQATNALVAHRGVGNRDQSPKRMISNPSYPCASVCIRG